MISSGCKKETNSTPQIKDIDGNVYTSVTIGTQVWMVENLRVTKYRNGDPIATTDPTTKDITSESEPKYQWTYTGAESNIAKNGRLYTWYAAVDARNIAPEGWHVPSDAEWTVLTNYLANNDFGYAGSLTDLGKSIAAITGWNTNNTEGNIGNDQGTNNSSKFTGYPAGYRLGTGVFENLGMNAIWWTTTSFSDPYAYDRNIFYNQSVVHQYYYNKEAGFAIRCIKDLNQ